VYKEHISDGYCVCVSSEYKIITVNEPHVFYIVALKESCKFGLREKEREMKLFFLSRSGISKKRVHTYHLIAAKLESYIFWFS